MSGTYTRYTVEDADGNEVGTIWEQHEYRRARESAMLAKGKVIANEYEWVDSELVDDFTESDDEDEEEES
jgi:hypothetical protein